ncbi:alpha/beta fold hydrolase [Nocardia otitidiscaviarum]|uniref:alpha/beta hydrolase n=1 Tax=Nocardia otitidiscaviarum TaxID=1823 RepID=UPI0018932257|nr:alpha/beta fold hydrolase [Nocardia otitidiscaviarum]MBF6236484.1 alpha/beta fold hydrolase [Nocardia otitidiscaviarum]
MRYFEGVSGLVHYRRWPVENPRAVVVLLHGLGQQSADYHRFCRAANRSGIDVWGIDHIGHGLSEGDSEAMPPIDDLAANAVRLTALARTEHPELPLIMVGHSLGAGTALIAMQDRGAVVDSVSGVVLLGSPERAAILDVPAPRVPTLVLHGSDDRRAPIAPIKRWCAQRPGTRMREFLDAGHDLLHEPGYRAVTETILEFVQDAVRRTSMPARRVPGFPAVAV